MNFYETDRLQIYGQPIGFSNIFSNFCPQPKI
jgi:hypothetical protein